MKTTLIQSDLAKWMNVVVRTIPNRAQVPVLSNVLIEGEKDGTFLSTTNLEVGLRVNVGGKVDEVGAITIPAKNFSEFVGSMPAGNVILETEGEKVKVSGGKISATFTGIPATEFPVISRLDSINKEDKTIKLKGKMIGEISREVAFCAAADESRPVLTGVMFVADGKKLMVTATDGFRLSRRSYILDEEIPGFEKGMILPARTIMEAAKILTEGRKENLELGVVKGSSQVVLGYGDVEMASRVLEGNFPDVDKIIPKEWKTEVVVDKEDLLRSVRAAGIFARDSANVVRFVVEENSLMVESSSTQTGESRTQMDAEVKGDDVRISFNYRYLLDFLGSVDAERIIIRVNDGTTAGIFGIDGDDALLHLIMPVRV